MSKKDKNGGEEASTDTTLWMVTFGDLLMLLLTFFVMLLTMSSMDTKSLKSMFSIFEGASGPLEFGDQQAISPPREVASGHGGSAMSSLKALSYLKEISAKMPHTGGKTGARVTSVKMLKDYFTCEDDDEHAQILFGLESIMQFSQDNRGIVMTFQANIVFNEGQAEIRPESRPLLDIVANVLASTQNRILVMGHSDNRPIHNGRYRSNWELSLFRALNIQRYFVERRGLSPERFGVGGYGDTRPQASNDTPGGRAKNRRVEIILR
ncbi:MAG: OmpA family protein [Deltaproteobacteria bacterium]|nr:OmpA family protein [Deltaproteobacteria bacterium]